MKRNKRGSLAFRETYLAGRIGIRRKILVYLLVLAGFTTGMELRVNESRPGDQLAEEIHFNPERQTAVIRCSICTGEKVAGFKDKESGRFREVMVIRSPGDEQRFKETYHLDSVKTEY